MSRGAWHGKQAVRGNREDGTTHNEFAKVKTANTTGVLGCKPPSYLIWRILGHVRFTRMVLVQLMQLRKFLAQLRDVASHRVNVDLQVGYANT